MYLQLPCKKNKRHKQSIVIYNVFRASYMVPAIKISWVACTRNSNTLEYVQILSDFYTLT